MSAAAPLAGWAVLALSFVACARTPEVTLARSGHTLRVDRPALYPETIEYDSAGRQFLLGSFREGAIYRVNDAGKASIVVDDPRLCSVLGIAIDARRGRLWAVNSDLGASLKSSAAGARHLAAVGVYDLTTGAAQRYVDLGAIVQGPHLLNGIALDAAGDAYVTDSFSPAIYQVSAQGTARVFLQDPQFAGDGINLNGVVVHPGGYLLVIKKSDGALFKVPLAEPARFSRVAVATRFVGGDGLTLLGKTSLVVIANQTPATASNAAFALVSDDDWASASVRAVQPLGAVYPTTAVLRDGKLYVVHSRLNELIQAAPAAKPGLRLQASIEEIGRFGE